MGSAGDGRAEQEHKGGVPMKILVCTKFFSLVDTNLLVFMRTMSAVRHLFFAFLC